VTAVRGEVRVGRPMEWRRATVLSVHDGDTPRLAIDRGACRGRDRDLGFDDHARGGRRVHVKGVRLFGLNAPELETRAGRAARDALAEALPEGSVVSLTTWLHLNASAAGFPSGVDDKYGRVLGAVRTAAGLDVNAWLVRSGYAALWDGLGRKPVPA
jgi:endonuclease YncB( thermonuclease family)